jgi:hypothetical protein
LNASSADESVANSSVGSIEAPASSSSINAQEDRAKRS